VKAKDEDEARVKAQRLYRKRMEPSYAEPQEGWLVESDGEDR